MIKCTNCNQENPDGSKFCSNCGKKLEVFITCSSCGGQIAYGSSFCPFCGKNLKGQAGGILTDSVVSGDVSVDTSTKIYTSTKVDSSTNYNNSTVNIYNQSISEIAIKCHACGKALHKSAGDAYKCSKCKETFCSDHFNLEMKLCSDCADEANRLFHSRMYDEARVFYESVIKNGATDPDVYYYAAICLLNGKKAFLQQRSTIDTIVKYMNNAISLEAKAIYYYFLAYIKYDYFERKYLNVNPDYRTCYKSAALKGLAESEVRKMYSLIGVDRPSCL